MLLANLKDQKRNVNYSLMMATNSPPQSSSRQVKRPLSSDTTPSETEDVNLIKESLELGNKVAKTHSTELSQATQELSFSENIPSSPDSSNLNEIEEKIQSQSESEEGEEEEDRKTDILKTPEKNIPLTDVKTVFSTPIVTATTEKPKFVFGSAAKTLTSFQSVSKSEFKADFGRFESLSSTLSSDPLEKEAVNEENEGEEDESKIEGELFGGGRRKEHEKDSKENNFTKSEILKTTTSGEEEEQVKFSAKGKLFEFDSSVKEWREKGIGLLKVNENLSSGEGRLLMRQDGVLKVLLNSRIFPGMNFEAVQGRSVRIAVIVDGKPSPVLLRFRSEEDAQALLLELTVYSSKEE